MNEEYRFDIEVYSKYSIWAQAKYLVHGYDDVFWTDSIDDALSSLKEELVKCDTNHKGKETK